MSHTDTPEAIHQEVRKYWAIFGGLAALTIVTVAISYLHLKIHLAVALAMLVAIVKGSLVACYFMHLISEKMFIYILLIFTVIFISGLFTLPIQYMDPIRGTIVVH